MYAANMGLGYTNMAEHYLGLRDLIQDHPQQLRSAVVFIDVPCGMPEVGFADMRAWGWDGRWFHGAQPQILASVMRVEDLSGFWHSTGGVEDKLQISTRTLLSDSAAFAHRERLREDLLGLSQRRLWATLADMGLEGAGGKSPGHDLTTAGGIRTDD